MPAVKAQFETGKLILLDAFWIYPYIEIVQEFYPFQYVNLCMFVKFLNLNDYMLLIPPSAQQWSVISLTDVIHPNSFWRKVEPS